MGQKEKNVLRIKRNVGHASFSDKIKKPKRINYLQRYGLTKQFRAIKKDIRANKEKKEKWEKVNNNKFIVAVLVRALIDAYCFKPGIYLYSLLVIQKLHIQEIPFTSIGAKEMASAVFLVSIKILGEGAQVPIEHFMFHFGNLDPYRIHLRFDEIFSKVSGLPILKVIREKNIEIAIFEIEKSMKELLPITAPIILEELPEDKEKDWDNMSTLSWSKSI